MSELTNPNSAIARQIIALLSHYGFDLRGYSPDELAVQWLNVYHEHWVRLAVIEALYQGRYKSISIEQILTFWARRQHPIFHFNHDFERLICRKLPRHLTDLSQDADEEIAASINRSWLNSTATHQPSQTLTASPLVEQPTSPDDSPRYLDVPKPVEQESPTPDPTTGSPTETMTPATPEAVPELIPALMPSSEASVPEASPESIHSFTPPPDGSGCYRKLQAVAHQSITSQETA